MKATHVAVTMVVFSVAGVLFLTGITRPAKPATAGKAATALPEAPPPAVVAAPLPPLAGDVWDLPTVDARLCVPKGWTRGAVQGDERLLRYAADPLGGNMNLLVMPNPFDFSLEELVQENCEELSANPDLQLEDRRELEVLGRKVLRFDYTGTPRGGTELVRFVTVVWKRGRSQVVLTTTVRASEWGAVQTDVEAALETLQIRWPVQPAK